LQVLILFSRSAIWVWRGQGLAFELAEDWQVDYASYAWQKLDPKVSPVFCFFFTVLGCSGTLRVLCVAYILIVGNTLSY
jgi:hypothetical protein